MKQAVRGLAILAVLTIACSRLQLGFSITAFVFLIAVVLNSIDGGFRTAVGICVASVLLLDYFFTLPLNSFRIDDPLALVALLGFGTSALVVTRLGAEARRERDNMRQLYQVAQQLLEVPKDPASLPAPYMHVLEPRAVCLFDGGCSQVYSAGPHNATLERATRQAFASETDCDEIRLGFTVRCLRSASGLLGAIGFEALPDAAHMAGPLAALAAGVLDQSLAHSRAEAESNRGAILDALAHEFKTPLATILMCADAVRETPQLTPEQARFAGLIESEASRLSTLTTRLLRIARLDAQEVKPHLDYVDLVSLVRRWMDRESATHKGATFQMDADLDECEVLADAELILLAIGNLLENAARHGTLGVPIAVRVMPGEVSVWSAGEPIPAANRTRIFQRFYRSTSGSGLGLYVAWKIARAHGGDLRLEPPDGSKGNRFTLRLPACAPSLHTSRG